MISLTKLGYTKPQYHLCYYQLPYRPKFIDIGNNNIHPGPKQNQWYADQINKIIKDLT
jgi:hypothetical protein